MTSKFCQLWLSCSDTAEAGRIAQALLDQKLIVCAKQIPVNSKFRWQGKIEDTKEILLMMESRVDLFDQIEAEVEKLHSYDTFVLEATVVERVSKDAQSWLDGELDG